MHNPLHGPAASASDSHVKDAVLIAIAEQLATEEAMIKQAAETEKIMNDIDRYDRAMEQLRNAQRWEKRGWIIPTIILGAIFTALALLAYQNELHRHPSVLRVVRRHSHFVTGELDTTEFGMNGTSLSEDLVNDFEFRAKPLRDERKAYVRKGIEKEFICDDMGCQTRARKGFECPQNLPDMCHTILEQQQAHFCKDVAATRGVITGGGPQGRKGAHNFPESEKCGHLRTLRAYCDTLQLHCAYSSLNGKFDRPLLCGMSFGSPIWNREHCCHKPQHLCELKGYGNWDLQRTITQLRDKCECDPVDHVEEETTKAPAKRGLR